MVDRQFTPSVRYTNGLRIYFKDKQTVQVSNGEIAIYISRWAIKQNGYYRNVWKPFCEKLRRSNRLETIWDVMDLAQSYELDMMSSRDGADKLPDKIKEHPSHYKGVTK